MFRATMLVPTAGLEPAQVAPLARLARLPISPRRLIVACGQTSRGSLRRPSVPAALRADTNIQSLTSFGFRRFLFDGVVARRSRRVAGAARRGIPGAQRRLARSLNTDVGSTVACEPIYARLKLVTKNRANTRQSKTGGATRTKHGADAPEPGQLPPPAPLATRSAPRDNHQPGNTYTPKITPRNIKNLFGDEWPRPRDCQNSPRSRKRHPQAIHPALRIALRHCRHTLPP